MAKKIPTRAEDYAQWYVELVKGADVYLLDRDSGQARKVTLAMQ